MSPLCDEARTIDGCPQSSPFSGHLSVCNSSWRFGASFAWHRYYGLLDQEAYKVGQGLILSAE